VRDVHPHPGLRRPERLDPRLTSAMRVFLVGTGALIYPADPSGGAAGLRSYAFAVLAAFFLYSAIACVAILRGSVSGGRWLPWIDLGWITLLAAVSGGTSTIYFPLYLFAILCAAFEGGRHAGMEMVAASFLSFSFVGIVTAPTVPSHELDRALIRPTYVLVLGYLVSVLGDHELRLRRRLAFLREAVALANPRFGANHLVARLVARLREFYDADACRVVVREASGECWMWSARRGAAPAGAPDTIPGTVAAALLPDPPAAAFLCRAGWGRGTRAEVMAVTALDRGAGKRWRTVSATPIAAALDARAFVSVPFPGGDAARARLYVASRRRGAFARDDVEFLVQIVEQVSAMLEKVRVADKLATDAAEEERRRIARDIHDSIVQPYVGFALGLAGVREALRRGRASEACGMVEQLLEVSKEEVEGLRSYMRALHDGPHRDPDVLASAIHRYCARFSSVTGIDVDVVTEGEPHVEPRIAGEVFQIVAEALSNVRRHTDAATASVRIASRDDRVVVQIENDTSPAPTGAPRFSPKSLGERAAALGGSVEVYASAPHRTAIRVDIPL
jgi:signal transduction histidine kinase